MDEQAARGVKNRYASKTMHGNSVDVDEVLANGSGGSGSGSASTTDSGVYVTDSEEE